MFEYMGDRLSKAIKNIRGMGRITEDNISEAMREIRMALLEADVNYQVVKEFINNVKEKALGQDVLKSLTPGQQIIKIVNPIKPETKNYLTNGKQIVIVNSKGEKKEMRKSKSVAILAEMGTGKTLISIGIAGHLYLNNEIAGLIFN